MASKMSKRSYLKNKILGWIQIIWQKENRKSS
jgi:hypothetical protein